MPVPVTAPPKAARPYQRSGSVEQFEVLLVDRHVLAEGDRRGLGAADQVHPAPRLAGGVEFLDDRLVMLEGVHLGEVVVADDLGEALRSTPAGRSRSCTYCCARLTVSLTSGTARICPRLVTLDQSVGGWL